MQKYQWREHTEEGIRFFRAEYHAGRWNFLTQLKGDEEWDDTFEADQEVWEKMREILWAKYQRKRCNWKILQSVDKMLKKEYGVIPPHEES